MKIAPLRFDAPTLRARCAALFEATGLEADKAAVVARSLVMADMMGHTTHGLALAPWYLDAIAAGTVATHGEPELVRERGACITWQGRRLPGSWLIERAIDVALERIDAMGQVTVTIANSHHTGALAVYLPRLTERGLMGVIACSGPGARGVAPFGGLTPVYTPNPIAAGFPTDGDPVLLDVSASITTLNRARQLTAAGEKFAGAWAQDASGEPTDDPALVVSGVGSLLPTGGLDHGHKGYSLALLVEALTQGLPGYGRADAPIGATLGVTVQVYDPDAFGGREAFIRQTSWLAAACRASTPRPGGPPVRLPGEHGMRLHRQALADGVPLAADVVQPLQAALARHRLPALSPNATHAGA